MSWIRYVIFAVLLIFSSLSIVESAQNPDLTGTSIVINIPSRTLELYSGKNLIKQYPVAVGKPSTPTPLGRYSITSKEYNPAWYPPDGGQIVPSGPDNPLGYRWMAFLSTYGIHGTNAPWSIGSFASGGCFRMGKKDVEELYEWLPLGTAVTVEGRRDKVHNVVQLNSMGQEVAILQLRLKALGYYSGRADGKFGSETERALERFQLIKGLEPTGVADKKTISLLGI